MSNPEPLSSDELRRRLLDAVTAGDRAALEELCSGHKEAIITHFPQWRALPQGVRAFQPLADRYVQGLIAVAQLFEERFGRREPMEALTGPPGSNPLVKWQEAIARAQSLMQDLKYAQALGLLGRCLEEVRGLKGSGVMAYLPATYGLIGECHFQLGQADKAIAPTGTALELCVKAGDAEGERTYLGNLYEVHRYRGDAAAAASCAQRLAEALDRQGDRGEALRYRKQAQRVSAGEPLDRIVCNIDGQRYELDEAIAMKAQRVQFAFERNRLTLRPAQALTARGQEVAGQGRYEEALAHFEQAAIADRYDPHCQYQSALTLLCLKRYPEAVAAYERTEALAPGWFHCRADQWMAEQLASGRFNHAVFHLYRALEDGPEPPQEKLAVAEQVLAQAPNLAFVQHARGRALVALSRRDEAAIAFRKGLDCVEEPDLRTRLLVDLATVTEDNAQKRPLLDEAVRLQGNLVAAAMAALLLARDEQGGRP